MNISEHDLRQRLETLDLSAGLTRDQIREQLPDLPDEAYLYLPAAKKFYSVNEVVRQTGAYAAARAEGEFVREDLDMPTEGAQELDGPPGFGPSLTGADQAVQGTGDYPGLEDDLAGSSLETRAGRGTPGEEYRGERP